MTFKEDLLQYIWKYRLFEAGSLITRKGETIHIANPGIQNFHSGPDFKNAKIYIDNSVYNGNIELHIDPSDWYAHSHHLDHKYNSVILHVSLNSSNININTLDGKDIPQLILKDKINRSCLLKYDLLLKNSLKNIPCAKLFSEVSSMLPGIYTELLHQRIIRKSHDVNKILITNNDHYSRSFVVYLIQNFGMKFNSEGFKALSEAIDPDSLLNTNSISKEALLFGQAGLLSKVPSGPYEKKLIELYQKIKKERNLKEIKPSKWKFTRIRPNNFPTIRIAQLSTILSSTKSLWNDILSSEDVEEIRDLFRKEASKYWNTHYTFGKESSFVRKIVGNKSIDHIVINVIVPFMYHYSNINGRPDFVERSLNLLYQCKPEDNAIVSIWEELGVNVNNAGQTQALTQLKTEFCDKFKCLQCKLGQKLLKRTTPIDNNGKNSIFL
ncbi:MAG: DUF2851 family protein [Chitinophagales bacterium]|nr:DUF2851 family protein [Chitinophagales bacterium]